jgi:hypothetical protein
MRNIQYIPGPGGLDLQLLEGGHPLGQHRPHSVQCMGLNRNNTKKAMLTSPRTHCDLYPPYLDVWGLYLDLPLPRANTHTEMSLPSLYALFIKDKQCCSECTTYPQDGSICQWGRPPMAHSPCLCRDICRG